MTYDLAIIGGGPAGVAAGVYAARKRLRTIFITGDFQGQSAVSEGIENWVGSVKISGLDLAKNLEAHLRAYATDIVDIKTGELCSGLTKNGELFSITTNKATYEAKTVLIATGSSRRKLDIPGAKEFEHKGITYCATCDAPMFGDMEVAVIGGGNAGLESAAQLLAYAKKVYILHRHGEFKADPMIIEKVLKNPKTVSLLNTTPTAVIGDKFATGLTYTDIISKEVKTIPVQGIFVEIGSVPATAYAKGLVELDGVGHVVTNPATQRTSVPGVWAAGDCTDGLYHQNNIAAGDGVKALEDIYNYLHRGK
jgi:thioredoxin reductase